MKKMFGEILLEKGIIKIGDVDNALVEQKSGNKKLGEILLEQGLITYEHIAIVLEEQGWERKYSAATNVNHKFISENLDIKELIDNSILPYEFKDDVLYVIVDNPGSEYLKKMKTTLNVKSTVIYIDSKLSINKKLTELENIDVDVDTFSMDSEVWYFNIEDVNLEKKIKSYIIDEMKNGVNKIEIKKDETVEGLYKVSKR